MKTIIGQLKNSIENFRFNQRIPGSPEYKKALKDFQMMASPVTVYRLIDYIEKLESMIEDMREERRELHA